MTAALCVALKKSVVQRRAARVRDQKRIHSHGKAARYKGLIYWAIKREEKTKFNRKSNCLFAHVRRVQFVNQACDYK